MAITKKEWRAIAANIARNYVSDGNIADKVRAGSAQRAVSRAAHGICDTLAELARNNRSPFSRYEFLEICRVPHDETPPATKESH